MPLCIALWTRSTFVIRKLEIIACIFFAFAVRTPSAADGPVRMIFDTDMGNDVDDALALAVIHELADRSEVELLAVTLSKDNPWAAPYIDAVNTFYGRPDVPIGSFLLVGRTGTGKTELAKALARTLYKRPARLVRIDCSE